MPNVYHLAHLIRLIFDFLGVGSVVRSCAQVRTIQLAVCRERYYNFETASKVVNQH